MDKIAIYLRLSLEDMEDKDESGSISSQRSMILDYINHSEDLKDRVVSEFCDDGYSGTSMERPGMQKLLSEVRANRIGCVIVKDMSRFSRNYIELGTYMNQIFPFLGVRFIALGDHYDSKEHAGSTTPLDTSFQMLLYDLYSKDVSMKVKSSFENKFAGGEYVFGQVPFGYEKSKEKKNMIIVNEKEAEIVRHIFALALDGNSSTQIARLLNEEGIPTRRQIRRQERTDEGGKVRAWDNVSVRTILNNRFYLGEMACGKSKRKYAGSKNGIMLPRQEWRVIPGHHEPLVTPEDYEKASLFHTGASTKRKTQKNPLVGKLFCGGCGYSMTYKPMRGKNKYRRFECRKHALLHIQDCCTYFPADLLEEIVLTMLNQELMLRGDTAKQKGSLAAFHKLRTGELEKKLGECKSRKKKLQEEKTALYESYALGGLPAPLYRQKADSLAEQISFLSTSEKQYLAELETIRGESCPAEKEKKRAVQSFRLETLTQEAVDAFIKRIYVYRNRRTFIEWNFHEEGEFSGMFWKGEKTVCV